MTRSGLRGMLWLLARLVLCIAALGYVFSRTEMRDTILLTDRQQPVRLLDLGPDGARVVLDAQPVTVPLERVQREPDGQPAVRRGLLSLAATSHKLLLALAIAVYGVSPLLQIVRFRWMLRLQETALSWPVTVGVCLIGNFYSYVIPGTTGGDVVRAAYLARGTPNPHAALVAIGLDRLTGLAGLLGLAALAGLLMPVDEPTVRSVAGVSALLLVAMVVGFVAVTGWGFVGRWLGRLPLGSHLQMLYEAASASRRGWATLAAAALLTVVLQAGAMGSFGVAAVALGMDPDWGRYFVCLPASLVVASIPIVPMGLGSLELMMVFLLAGHVGSAGQVLGLAFAMRVIGLIWALPGGLVPLLWNRPALGEVGR